MGYCRTRRNRTGRIDGALLYWASPNARQGFRWISPGAALAVIVWVIGSGLFALYVANFGHYNKVYGSIAGMIIFLIWLWLSNAAILLGAEFNPDGSRKSSTFENLANAGKLPATGALLFCIPMKIGKGTGAPTRIFAVLP